MRTCFFFLRNTTGARIKFYKYPGYDIPFSEKKRRDKFMMYYFGNSGAEHG